MPRADDIQLPDAQSVAGEFLGLAQGHTRPHPPVGGNQSSRVLKSLIATDNSEEVAFNATG